MPTWHTSLYLCVYECIQVRNVVLWQFKKQGNGTISRQKKKFKKSKLNFFLNYMVS